MLIAKIKSTFFENILWILITGFLLWYVFISVIVMDLFGVIPTILILSVAFMLRFKHIYLSMSLQLWGIYLCLSSGLKLLAAYMQSIGSITYDWTTTGMYRNIFFIAVAGFLFYISRWQIIEMEED